MASPETHKGPFNPMDHIEIVAERDGGLIEAYVPAFYIMTEEVPVDDAHVRELASSMHDEAQHTGRTGQLSPALLGHVAGEIGFPIIDGFHRTDAIMKAGGSEVYATIRPNTSWEDVMDLRIIAAHTQRTVRFARVVEWIENVWEMTPWSDKVDVLQAFVLANNVRGTGAKLGLDPGEVRDIKEWVEAKSTQWKLSPSSIQMNLQTAKTLDPKLVAQAREGRGKGAGSKGLLTPVHLRAIGAALPDQFDKQEMVADMVKEQGLSSDETQVVAGILAGVDDIERAKTILESGSWRQLSAPARTTGRPRQDGVIKEAKKPIQVIAELRHLLMVDELRLAHIGLQNAVLKGRYSGDDYSAGSATEFPHISGIEIPSDAWSDEDRKRAMNHLATMEPEALKQLSKRLDESESRMAFKQAITSLGNDILAGPLSFIKLDNGGLNKALSAYLNYALSETNRLSAMSSSDVHDEVIELGSTRPGHVIAFAAEAVLPELEDKDREAFIMNAFYGVSSRAISKILEIPDMQVNQNFTAVKQMLESKTLISKGKWGRSNSPVNNTVYAERGLGADTHGLTPTELEIVLLLTTGMTNQEIADARFLSTETVKSHVRHILDKTGAKKRAEVVSMAYESGLIQPS